MEKQLSSLAINECEKINGVDNSDNNDDNNDNDGDDDPMKYFCSSCNKKEIFFSKLFPCKHRFYFFYCRFNYLMILS